MEQWKDIPNYEGIYQISDLGNIKSLKFGKEKLLKSQINNYGYLYINLWKNGSKKVKQIHELLAIVFLGHVPNLNKLRVDHKDNNKLNNALSNIQIVKIRENNSKDRKLGSSKYTGVFWHKRNKKWISSITIDRKQKHLGYFDEEYDAHLAYQKALKEL
jgi:hypothetical protein